MYCFFLWAYATTLNNVSYCPCDWPEHGLSIKTLNTKYCLACCFSDDETYLWTQWHLVYHIKATAYSMQANSNLRKVQNLWKLPWLFFQRTCLPWQCLCIIEFSFELENLHLTPPHSYLHSLCNPQNCE